MACSWRNFLICSKDCLLPFVWTSNFFFSVVASFWIWLYCTSTFCFSCAWCLSCVLRAMASFWTIDFSCTCSCLSAAAFSFSFANATALTMAAFRASFVLACASFTESFSCFNFVWYSFSIRIFSFSAALTATFFSSSFVLRAAFFSSSIFLRATFSFLISTRCFALIFRNFAVSLAKIDACSLRTSAVSSTNLAVSLSNALFKPASNDCTSCAFSFSAAIFSSCNVFVKRTFSSSAASNNFAFSASEAWIFDILFVSKDNAVTASCSRFTNNAWLSWSLVFSVSVCRTYFSILSFASFSKVTFIFSALRMICFFSFSAFFNKFLFSLSDVWSFEMRSFSMARTAAASFSWLTSCAACSVFNLAASSATSNLCSDSGIVDDSDFFCSSVIICNLLFSCSAFWIRFIFSSSACLNNLIFSSSEAWSLAMRSFSINNRAKASFSLSTSCAAWEAFNICSFCAALFSAFAAAVANALAASRCFSKALSYCNFKRTRSSSAVFIKVLRASWADRSLIALMAASLIAFSFSWTNFSFSFSLSFRSVSMVASICCFCSLISSTTCCCCCINSCCCSPPVVATAIVWCFCSSAIKRSWISLICFISAWCFSSVASTAICCCFKIFSWFIFISCACVCNKLFCLRSPAAANNNARFFCSKFCAADAAARVFSLSFSNVVAVSDKTCAASSNAWRSCSASRSE